VVPPAALPLTVDTLLVGLNPLHARRAISEVGAFQWRHLKFFYL